MERKKNLIFRLLPAICAVFLVLSTTSCFESYEEQHWNIFRENISKDKNVPDSLKKEILAMSFYTFLKENPLKKETDKYNALCNQEMQKGDSIWNTLIPPKETELQAEREKYQGRTKILTIKRLWLNGNTLPWTYQSWLRESYRFSGSRFSGSITPQKYGHAKYTGNNKLDYINVVFSDNSYKRFLIKDNPEWLLAKTDEKVEARYIIKDYKVGTDVGCVLEKNAYDLVIGIEYVPLFK